MGTWFPLTSPLSFKFSNSQKSHSLYSLRHFLCSFLILDDWRASEYVYKDGKLIFRVRTRLSNIKRHLLSKFSSDGTPYACAWVCLNFFTLFISQSSCGDYDIVVGWRRILVLLSFSLLWNLWEPHLCEIFQIFPETHPLGALLLFRHVLPESGDFPDSGTVMQL